MYATKSGCTDEDKTMNYQNLKLITDKIIDNEYHGYSIADAEQLLNIYLQHNERMAATAILIKADCVTTADEQRYKAENMHLYFPLEMINRMLSTYYHAMKQLLYDNNNWLFSIYAPIKALPLTDEEADCLFQLVGLI